MAGIESANNAAEQAEKAAETMEAMMPEADKMSDSNDDMDISVGEMPEEELNRITDGYPEEVDAKNHPDLVKEARSNLSKLNQGSSYGPIEGPDGEYLYVYDPSQTPADRLFMREAEDQGGEMLTEELGEGYKPVKGKMAKQVLAQFSSDELAENVVHTIEGPDGTLYGIYQKKVYKQA